MHTSARCQALSLPLINYGKARIEKETLRADITGPAQGSRLPKVMGTKD
jgi:hypothetical protein